MKMKVQDETTAKEKYLPVFEIPKRNETFAARFCDAGMRFDIVLPTEKHYCTKIRIRIFLGN